VFDTNYTNVTKYGPNAAITEPTSNNISSTSLSKTIEGSDVVLETPYYVYVVAINVGGL
jgi:hypothetical protein